MKNRILALIAFVLTFALSVTALVSCGDDEPAPGPATHTHTFSSEWKYDVNQHWQMTSCDGHSPEKGNIGPHTYAEGSETCSACGYLNHRHEQAADWSVSDFGHWHEITCCVDVVPTVSEHVGYADDLVCDECGAHVHTYNKNVGYVTDDEAHWYTATCEHTDHKVRYEAHSGMSDCTCDTCGKVYHPHSNTFDKDASGHWYSTTCSHPMQIDFESHQYGENHKCKCGYTDPKYKPTELPIIPA